jgi:hypothetical protein
MTCYSYTGGGARQYNVYPNTRSWTETGVTWGNKPPFVGSPNASVSIAGTGVASWDVTAIVQDWVDLTLPQWGFVVIDDDELDDSDAFAYFRAREYTGTADDPTLEITYTPPPVTTVSIGDVTILENSWGTVNITIDTTEPIGVGSIWLNVFWDDSVIDLATPSITGTDFDSSSGVVHSGNTTIIAYDLTQVGPGTDLLVATLNFTADAGSSPLDCTDLDIEVLSIYDGTSGDPQLITPDAVNDGEACIGYDWYEGDINDSGGATPAVAVTVADTQMLSQHLRFNIVLVDEPFMAADVDDGNVVDSADIQMIAQFVASIISAFPGGIYIP